MDVPIVKNGSMGVCVWVRGIEMLGVLVWGFGGEGWILVIPAPCNCRNYVQMMNGTVCLFKHTPLRKTSWSSAHLFGVVLGMFWLVERENEGDLILNAYRTLHMLDFITASPKLLGPGDVTQDSCSSISVLDCTACFHINLQALLTCI